MTRGRDLMQKVLDEMAEHARTGEPYDDDGTWTCGRCFRQEGVKQYVVDVGVEAGNVDVRGRFQYRLVCPCCSFKGCPHRTVAVAVATR